MDLLWLIWFVDNSCAMTKINGNSVLKINGNSWVKRVGNRNRKKYCRVKEILETVVSRVVVGVGGDRGGGGVIIDWMTLSFSGWSGILIESKLVTGWLKGRGFRRVWRQWHDGAGMTAISAFRKIWWWLAERRPVFAEGSMRPEVPRVRGLSGANGVFRGQETSTTGALRNCAPRC